MKPGPEGAVLHAVRATDALTAIDAVAWFAPGTPSDAELIGYLLSARSATWVRVRPDGTTDHVRGDGDVLAEAYEVVLFDGERELRWLRTPGGRGPAVALGEDPAGLPSGDDVTPDPPLRRGEVQPRLLAGTPRPHSAVGWTTLGSERYAAAHLPFTFDGGDVLQVEFAEYLTEDAHGNVDVVDTRLLRLRTNSREAVQVWPAPVTNSPEGAPA